MIYNFCSDYQNFICLDGSAPRGGVVQANDGNFYGTTSEGGTANLGTVFKLTPSGQITTLHSFCSQGPPCPDGEIPWAPPIQASDGNLYGTTVEGGAAGMQGGTVYKITLDGNLTTLHSFCFQSCLDGFNLEAGLIQGSDGNLYGPVAAGGKYGYGTLYKMATDGSFNVLYNFCSQPECTDGIGPEAPLIQGADGNFYGTTYEGGSGRPGPGTIYKITPAGALTTLYTFCQHPLHGWCPDGGRPQSPLSFGSNGYLVSSTFMRGLVFGYGPTGKYVQFVASTDAGLLQGTDGAFYGLSYGGIYNYGTVFSISAGLAPFVTTTPAFGSSGAPVIILGTNLTNATAVTFNGTPATFTVVSASEITTTVPSGATTGKVNVTTPSGTLISNLPFVVQ